MTQPCPVKIRGVLYPSQAAAARALGVKQTNISKALDAGTIDNIGLGRNFGRKKPLLIQRGDEPAILAQSQGEAARIIGITASVMQHQIMKHRKKGQASFIHAGWKVSL